MRIKSQRDFFAGLLYVVIGGGFAIGAQTMQQTLYFSIIGFCVLFSVLVILRWRQLRLEDHLSELREEYA